MIVKYEFKIEMFAFYQYNLLMINTEKYFRSFPGQSAARTVLHGNLI